MHERPVYQELTRLVIAKWGSREFNTVDFDPAILELIEKLRALCPYELTVGMYWDTESIGCDHDPEHIELIAFDPVKDVNEYIYVEPSLPHGCDLRWASSYREEFVKDLLEWLRSSVVQHHGGYGEVAYTMAEDYHGRD